MKVASCCGNIVQRTGDACGVAVKETKEQMDRMSASLNGWVPAPTHSEHQIRFPQFHCIADGAGDNMLNT